MVSRGERWSERMIGNALARQVFNRKCLVVVPNTTWTGDEIDLLAVTADLRIIDVEVKISRADVKADARKDKWLKPLSLNDYYERRRAKIHGHPVAPRERLEWPARMWKHYYAMPRDIWNAEIGDHLKAWAPRSGVILMTRRRDGFVYAGVERRSQPRRDAKPITAADALDLARLASLRMWDAYAELNKMRKG